MFIGSCCIYIYDEVKSINNNNTYISIKSTFNYIHETNN